MLVVINLYFAIACISQIQDSIVTKFILEHNENPFLHLMNLGESVHECGKIETFQSLLTLQQSH